MGKAGEHAAGVLGLRASLIAAKGADIGLRLVAGEDARHAGKLFLLDGLIDMLFNVNPFSLYISNFF